MRALESAFSVKNAKDWAPIHGFDVHLDLQVQAEHRAQNSALLEAAVERYCGRLARVLDLVPGLSHPRAPEVTLNGRYEFGVGDTAVGVAVELVKEHAQVRRE